eukprot:gene5880-7319_t
MFVSSNYGVDNSKECGYSIDQPCKSIRWALDNFYKNNVSNYQLLYPPLTLELDYGDYTGPDNNNINLYQYNITIKSPSPNDNNQNLNINKMVNLIPSTENDTVFSIITNYDDNCESGVTLVGVSVKDVNTRGSLLLVRHNSKVPVPLVYIHLNRVSITDSISPLTSFINVKQLHPMAGSNVMMLIKNCIFGNNRVLQLTTPPAEVTTNQQQPGSLYTPNSIFKLECMVELNIDHCWFFNNRGSSLFNVLGSGIITNSQFLNNTMDSGCITVWSTNLYIDNCTFTGNYAVHAGGALNFFSSFVLGSLNIVQSATIVNSTFVENYSPEKGGTFYVELVKPLTLINNTFLMRKPYDTQQGPLFLCMHSHILSYNNRFLFISSKSTTDLANIYQEMAGPDFHSVIQCYLSEICTFDGQLAEFKLCPEYQQSSELKKMAMFLSLLFIVPIITGLYAHIRHLLDLSKRKKNI